MRGWCHCLRFVAYNSFVYCKRTHTFWMSCSSVTITIEFDVLLVLINPHVPTHAWIWSMIRPTNTETASIMLLPTNTICTRNHYRNTASPFMGAFPKRLADIHHSNIKHTHARVERIWPYSIERMFGRMTAIKMNINSVFACIYLCVRICAL